MKLLDTFREQVKSLGTVKRAWFTTFNLNIPFFETHVLPALLDIDTPGSRLDFEAIQLQMAGIEVAVFCDLRVMDADQLKRTAVPVYGLLPERMGNPTFSKQSLFHPKVILLEAQDGRMVLGTGSANLTVHGWARNEEAFAFRPVASREQYQQIQRFFGPLTAAAGPDHALPPDPRNLHGTDKTWSFVHSFEERSFLDHLLPKGAVEDLTVWSPYFAKDLAGLLTRIRARHGEALTFSLVPDRVSGKRVRTIWTEELSNLLTNGVLSFHNPPSVRAKEIELTHAKIWLARGEHDARLAIGSWNCTTHGTASFDVRNVEAGMVFQIHPESEEIVGKKLSLNESHFSSLKEIEDDQPELLVPPPFELQVVFDWKDSRYRITGKLTNRAVGDGYSLRLPCVAEQVDLLWSPRPNNQAWSLQPTFSNVTDDEQLLTNHSYELWHKGEPVYRGLILQIHTENRRAQGYDSLMDLFNDLVDGFPATGGSRVRLREAFTKDGLAEDEEIPPADGAVAPSLTYFRMFQAFQKLRDRLVKASKEDLERHLFVYPSCLQETVLKVEAQVKESSSPVFQWFLLEELRSLSLIAEQRWDRRRARPCKWSCLKSNITVSLPANISGNRSYMKQLKELCRDD